MKEKVFKIIFIIIGIVFILSGLLFIGIEKIFTGLFFLLFGIFLIYYFVKNKVVLKINKVNTKDNSKLESKTTNNNSWSFWDDEIHKDEKQKRKQLRAVKAELNPYTLDKEKLSGEFVSASTGEIYKTTLSDCTCMSFIIDRVPCKHMYRLAYELGYMDPPKSKTY